MTPKIAEHLNSIRDNTLIIFTNESRDPVSGRAGFCMYVEQLGMKIGRALRWNEETRPREVIICSDSAAAREALRRGKSKARSDIIIDIPFLDLGLNLTSPFAGFRDTLGWG